MAARGVEAAAVGVGRRSYQDNGYREERCEAYQPREHGIDPGGWRRGEAILRELMGEGGRPSWQWKRWARIEINPEFDSWSPSQTLNSSSREKKIEP